MTGPETYHRQGHWDAVHRHARTGVAGGAVSALHASARAVLTGRLRSGSRLLDVACGTGGFLRTLPAGPRRIGADFSAEALRQARGATGAEGCLWIQADAARMPLRTGSLDTAVCLCTLWALARRERMMAALSRALRPGGMLVVHLWGPPRDCRLLTLGAVAIARVLPQMVRPDTVTGPFDLRPADVESWAADAGFGTPVWHHHRHESPIDGSRSYWREYAALAPTSYAAYAAAAPHQRSTVDRVLAGLLRQQRERTGEQTVALTWWLAAIPR